MTATVQYKRKHSDRTTVADKKMFVFIVLQLTQNFQRVCDLNTSAKPSFQNELKLSGSLKLFVQKSWCLLLFCRLLPTITI